MKTPKAQANPVARSAGMTPGTTASQVDTMAWRVNVVVGRDYTLAGFHDDTLTCGRDICDRATQGRYYADIVAGIEVNFASPDQYPTSHLLAPASDALRRQPSRPSRNSAARQRPPIPIAPRGHRRRICDTSG